MSSPYQPFLFLFQIAEESARARAAELRMQHESHEAELSALQKTLRSDTIKMVSQPLIWSLNLRTRISGLVKPI